MKTIKKEYTFDQAIVTTGTATIAQIIKASDSVDTLARSFYAALLGTREAKDITPEERQAYIKACTASLDKGQWIRLRRFGVLSTVAKEMGFTLATHKAGKSGGKTALSPELFKASTALRSAVAGMVKKGLSEADILAAVKVALAK